VIESELKLGKANWRSIILKIYSFLKEDAAVDGFMVGCPGT
jgi:hypothetical protein